MQRRFAGNLLNVKPILTIRDGEVVPLKRVRGNAKAFAEFRELFESTTTDSPRLQIGIAHAAAPERMNALRELVEHVRPQAKIEIATTLGAVVGTHAGPGHRRLLLVRGRLAGDHSVVETQPSARATALQLNSSTARASSRLAHAPRALRVGEQLVDARGEVGGEARGIDRIAVGAELDRHEQAGLAVDHHLRDAADGGCDDRRTAGHRLQVDDPERLVDRRHGEHGGMRQSSWITSGFGSISSIQTTPLTRCARNRSTRSRVARSTSGSSGAPAQKTSCAPESISSAASSRCTMPFCRVIRPTKRTVGSADGHAVALERVGRRIVGVLVGVDPVVDDLDPRRVDLRVGALDVCCASRSTPRSTASAASTAVRSQNDDSA